MVWINMVVTDSSGVYIRYVTIYVFFSSKMHFFHWLLDFHSTTAWSGTRSTSSSPMSLYISHQRSTEAEAPNPWSEWWSQRLRRFWPGKLIGNKSCCKSVPRSGSQLNLHVWEDDAHFGVSGDLSWASAVDIHVEGWLTPVDFHEGKRMQLRHIYIYIYSPQKPFPCDNVPKSELPQKSHTIPQGLTHSISFSHDSYTKTTWEFFSDPKKTSPFPWSKTHSIWRSKFEYQNP